MRINTINNAFLVARSIGETSSSARNPPTYSGHEVANTAKKLSRPSPIADRRICFKHVHAIFNLSSRGFAPSGKLYHLPRKSRIFAFPDSDAKIGRAEEFFPRFENTLSLSSLSLFEKSFNIETMDDDPLVHSSSRRTNIREFHDICRIKGAVLSDTRRLFASRRVRAAKAKWFSLGLRRRRRLPSISPSPFFGVLNPNRASPISSYGSSLSRFRLRSQPKGGEKASRCLRRTFTPPPRLEAGIAVSFELRCILVEKGRKKRRGKRREVDFDRISARYLLPPSLLYGKKDERKTSIPAISKRATFAKSPSSRLFGLPPPPPPSRPRCISMHLRRERERERAPGCNNIPFSPPLTYFYFIRHSRHEQGRIPVRGARDQ